MKYELVCFLVTEIYINFSVCIVWYDLPVGTHTFRTKLNLPGSFLNLYIISTFNFVQFSIWEKYILDIVCLTLPVFELPVFSIQIKFPVSDQLIVSECHIALTVQYTHWFFSLDFKRSCNTFEYEWYVWLCECFNGV